MTIKHGTYKFINLQTSIEKKYYQQSRSYTEGMNRKEACTNSAFLTRTKKPGTRPGSLFQTDVLLSGYSFTADRTINQLDVRHRRVVASAETALEDAQVATLTGSVTLAQVVEELTNDSFRTSTVESQTAVSQAVCLGQSDQRLSNAAQFFGFLAV